MTEDLVSQRADENRKKHIESQVQAEESILIKTYGSRAQGRNVNHEDTFCVIESARKKLNSSSLSGNGSLNLPLSQQ